MNNETIKVKCVFKSYRKTEKLMRWNYSLPFLLEVLRRRGFGPRFCNWVLVCLSTANTKVLINGFPGEQIFHARGLRQGDPISPQLFILVMDVLTAIFCRAEEAHIFEPLNH
jgi:hypothetical protein